MATRRRGLAASKVEPVLPRDSTGSGAGLNEQTGPAEDTAPVADPQVPRQAEASRDGGGESQDQDAAPGAPQSPGDARVAEAAHPPGAAPSAEAPEAVSGRRGLRRIAKPLGRALTSPARQLRRLRPTGAVPSAASKAEARRAAAAESRALSVEVAGVLFARLTVLPAVLILAWLIPGLPLLLAGDFLPVPMLLISVPLAVALGVNGLRVVPARWPRLLSGGRTVEPGWATWFGLLATVAVVAGLTAWQLSERSEALIVLRDAGTYLQAGYWIAQHGSLPIPEMAKYFGGTHPGVSFTSAGFLARGGSLYPAVTPGLPMLLAGSFWVHGTVGATAMAPVLGGLAALTFAGLVARLVGPQWAPAGALVLGLSLPQQFIGRTTLSESTLQIMLFGGLCLLGDSVALRGFGAAAVRRAAAAVRATVRPAAPALAAEAAGTAAPAAAGPVEPVPATPGSAAAAGSADPAEPDKTAVLPAPVIKRSTLAGRLASVRRAIAPARWAASLTPQRQLAVLAGLSLGFGLLMSLDALVYLLALIPFCCALFAGHRPQAWAFPAGWVLGVCYGLLGCYLLDRPFLDSVGPTVLLSGVVATWLIALSIVVMQLTRIARVRRVVPAKLARRPLRWLPEAGAVIALAALIGLAVRPYVQTVRGHPSRAEYFFIEALQRAQGLPVDPTRLYSEQTLYWTVWYIGLPTVLLGAFGVVLLLRRCLRALLTWRDPKWVWREWSLPLAVLCVGSAVSLWMPDIDPDQPWASRRLIVTVIPGLIICALWASSWLARRARDRGARPVTAAVAGLACVAAMLVPTVSTTFGLGLSHSGTSGGLTPVAQGLALSRTGAGELNAVADLCSQLPSNASVVIVGEATAAEFTQVIRGMCGVPVAWMSGRSVAAVDSVVGSISRVGRRPLLLAGRRAQLAAFGGTPVRVLDLATAQDPYELTQLPTAPKQVHYQIWLTAPSAAGVGA
jgi:hypothetical protein